MKINSTRYNTIICLLMALFVTVSCNKDTVSPYTMGDQIKMRVNVKGGIVTDSNKPKNQQRASASGSRSAISDGIQQQTIALGDGLTLVAKLVPQQEAAVPMKQSAGTGLKAVAMPVRNDLPVGTKYRLLVFDVDGEEVYRTDEEITATAQAYEEFALEVGESNDATFTFIAYSAGTADIPDFEGATLNDLYVTITDNHDKFMHFVETHTFSGSPDDSYELDVVLWNQFSEITTIIDATQTELDALIGVSDIYFEAASHESSDRATINLLDGSMTYLGIAEDKDIVFNTTDFPNTAVASQPTVLVHAATSAATLKIGDLNIRYNNVDFNRSAEVNNLQITPGVKYDLYLEINAWCLRDISEQEFDTRDEGTSSGGVLSADFTFLTTPGQDLVLNIAELDNSFNMVINGTPLATKEIEFQTETGIDHTARFTSGSPYHGEDGNADIWQMDGTKENPVIRVTVPADGGTPTLLAKRAQAGSLEPMELYNGAVWNTVTWYTDGTPNVVSVSQFETGVTLMLFYIDGGVAVVECGQE